MFWAKIWVNMGYDSRPRRSCAGVSPNRATHSRQLQLQHGQAAAHPVPRAVGSEECNEGVLVSKQCSVMQRCTVAAAASAPHDVQCPQPVQEPAAPASSMKQRLLAWQHSLWARGVSAAVTGQHTSAKQRFPRGRTHCVGVTGAVVEAVGTAQETAVKQGAKQRVQSLCGCSVAPRRRQCPRGCLCLGQQRQVPRKAKGSRALTVGVWHRGRQAGSAWVKALPGCCCKGGSRRRVALGVPLRVCCREGTHGGGVCQSDMFFCVCCVARSDACESEDAG